MFKMMWQIHSRDQDDEDEDDDSGVIELFQLNPDESFLGSML
jgi:hypothetical protein